MHAIMASVGRCAIEAAEGFNGSSLILATGYVRRSLPSDIASFFSPS